MFLFDKSLNKQTNNELNKYWLLFPQAAPLALKPIDGFYHRALLFITKDKFHTHRCDLYQKVGWFSTTTKEINWIIFFFTAVLKVLMYCTPVLHFKNTNYCTKMLDWFVFFVYYLWKNSSAFKATTTWHGKYMTELYWVLFLLLFFLSLEKETSTFMLRLIGYSLSVWHFVHIPRIIWDRPEVYLLPASLVYFPAVGARKKD